MARSGPLWAALVLAAGSLAGCAGLDSGDGGEAGSLVRIVEVDLGRSGFGLLAGANDPADALALADTRFEYTHGGAAVDPDAVTVEYVDDGGVEREAPLSRFTGADRVGRGDRVTIDGVLLTSPVTVRDGGDVLAARGLPPRDWLEAGGYPLPIAAEPGALAAWALDGTSRLQGSLDRIQATERGADEDYSCEETYDEEGNLVDYDCSSTSAPYTDTTRIEDLEARATLALDGTLSLRGAGSGAQPRLEAALDGTATLEASVDAHVWRQRTGEHPESVDARFGFELDGSADGDGLATLSFADGGQLRSVGGSGSLLVRAGLAVWDDEHPRSAAYRPAGFPDPLLDVSGGWEEPVPPSDPASFVARVLSDLWRMDLEPGDEFRLSGPDGGFGLPASRMAVRVAGEERKAVPAGAFDTVRIETTMSLEIAPPEGRAQSIELPSTTLWVDRASGVPVAFEQRMGMEFTREDLESVLGLAEAFGGDVDIERPGRFSFTADGTTTVELTQWEEGLRMAPMASVLSPMMGLGVPLAGMFLAPMGAFGDFGGEEAQAAPNIAFAKDSSALTLTVVAADSDVSWEELIVAGDAGCRPPPGGPVWAGDVVECASPGEVQVVHGPTNTLLYVSTF